MENSNLELFYDVLDESINFLYEKTHQNYMDLILDTTKNILSSDVLNDFENKEDVKTLTRIYERLEGIDFNVEDIRKSLQAIILKGFKESKIANGATTPDTLGMFIAYLISRFNTKKEEQINLLDPIIGTGNLVFSIANHLENPLKLYGVDHNELMINLAKVSSELLEQPLELLLQDTLSVKMANMDYVVFDCPYYEIQKGKYFPYELIIKHSLSLHDNAYMIGIIPEDFFDYDKEQKFKETILKTMSIISIIELPSSMFVGQGKSLIVLKKALVERNKCLMVKLPSFSDAKELNKSLVQIEAWFEKNIEQEKE